jgi:hypothetical protein
MDGGRERERKCVFRVGWVVRRRWNQWAERRVRRTPLLGIPWWISLSVSGKLLQRRGMKWPVAAVKHEAAYLE